MSLVKEFKSLTETKVLLLEVSKGKRKALIEKMVDHYFSVYNDATQEKVVRKAFNDFYPMFDYAYNNMYNMKMSLMANHTEDYEDSGFNYIINRESHKSYKKMLEGIGFFEEFDDHTFKIQAFYASIFFTRDFQLLEGVDPTGNMKYGNWLVDRVYKYALEKKWILSGAIFKQNSFKSFYREGRLYEDLPKLESYLKAYHEMKQKNELPEEYKDINKVVENFKQQHGDDVTSPLHILGHVTSEYRAVDVGDFHQVVDDKLEEGEDYRRVVEGETMTMYIPINQKGKSILGMGSEWCTTYGKHCLNPDYQSRSPAEYEGDLYIVVNNDNPEEKYQLHFGTGQYMDQNDNSVSLFDILDKDEKITRFFLQHKFDKLKLSGSESSIAKMFKKHQDILIKMMNDNLAEVSNYTWKAFLYAEDKLIDAIFNLSESELQKEYTANDPLFFGLRWNTDVIGYFVIGDEDIEELDRRGRANLSGYLFEWKGSLIRMENAWEKNFYKGNNKEQQLQYLAEFFEGISKEDRGEIHISDNLKQFVNNESS